MFVQTGMVGTMPKGRYRRYATQRLWRASVIGSAPPHHPGGQGVSDTSSTGPAYRPSMARHGRRSMAVRYRLFGGASVYSVSALVGQQSGAPRAAAPRGRPTVGHGRVVIPSPARQSWTPSQSKPPRPSRLVRTGLTAERRSTVESGASRSMWTDSYVPNCMRFVSYRDGGCQTKFRVVAAVSTPGAGLRAAYRASSGNGVLGHGFADESEVDARNDRLAKTDRVS